MFSKQAMRCGSSDPHGIQCKEDAKFYAIVYGKEFDVLVRVCEKHFESLPKNHKILSKIEYSDMYRMLK